MQPNETFEESVTHTHTLDNDKQKPPPCHLPEVRLTLSLATRPPNSTHEPETLFPEWMLKALRLQSCTGWMKYDHMLC